jgi:tetratricopeptide (TPR) repeat protein
MGCRASLALRTMAVSAQKPRSARKAGPGLFAPRLLISFPAPTHMKKTFPFRILAVLVLLACSLGLSAPLSYSNIKSLYKEGELEKIRVSLEHFLKQSGKSGDIKDRIFAYKYLGVVYAAEPQGYPVAETYFYQLLKLAPNAHISDLYVSTAVADLFERTQERFRKEVRDNSEFDEFGNPRPALDPGSVGLPPPKRDSLNRPESRPLSRPDTRKPPEKESKIRVWPWVVGGIAIVAIGGYWWYSNQKTQKQENRINGGGG